MEFTCEKWISVEIPFTAKNAIKDFMDAEADVKFVHESGKEMVMPAFWDGGCDWKVRFAPNELGKWNFTVSCTDNELLGLDGIEGTVVCTEYTGEYEMYKHGFIKTIPDVRYFVYDDGTPFFYLGDTHWAMLSEELDEAGPNAADVKTDSHFRFMVDKRLEQKFNVYMSEPIGHKYDIFDGIDDEDIVDFKRVDRYFKYLASKGMLHANSQFIFPGEVKERFFDKDFLRALGRFWVARYASYPVLWTLGQEVDHDWFGKNGITRDNNPYKDLARYLYQFDPYKHPLTAHQENAMLTGALGGSQASDLAWGAHVYTSQPSAFNGMKEHTWWGVQWRPQIHEQHNYMIPKDYWYNGDGKVTINYETRYDHLYTKVFGARANGWISYLCGMSGYGYGAADMWCYKSRYSFDVSNTDGVDTVTPEEKQIPWGKAIFLPTGDQMTYLYDFFNGFEWYKLVPDFDEANAFYCDEDDVFHVAAHIDDDTYVVYFYNKTAKTESKLVNMDENATYCAKWFDPVTGKYELIDEKIVPVDGKYTVPEKKADRDMVLFVVKNK